MELEVGDRLAAAEPEMPTIADNRPQHPARPPGPTRYTIDVPTQKTTLSLGEKSGKYINDVGITGRTDNHVHLEVVAATKTAVSLGSGATTVDEALAGYRDAADDDAIPAVPQAATGYAMVTDEHAWHDAKKQYAIVCREGDVVIRTVADPEKAPPEIEGEKSGGVAVLQSDHELAAVVSGKKAKLSAPTAVFVGAFAEATPEHMPYTKRYPALTLYKRLADTLINKTLKYAEVAQSVVELWDKVQQKAQQPKADESGWEEVDTNQKDIAEGIADLVVTLETEHAFWKQFTTPEPPTGHKVAIAAMETVSLSSDDVSVHANKGFSVTTGGAASVYGKKAEIKALETTSVVAGKSVSLKSLKDMTMAAEGGKATMEGNKGVEVTSPQGGLRLQAEKDAILNSVSEGAYLHGTSEGFLAGGGDKGFGVIAEETRLHMGKIASPNKLAGADIDDTCMIQATNKEVKTAVASATVTVTDKSIEATVSGATVKLDKNATVDGAKVLLG